MWIDITDLESNKITLNTAQMGAIMVPSPLTRGDGKCRILCGTLLIEVHRSEALRVREAVTGALEFAEAGAKES